MRQRNYDYSKGLHLKMMDQETKDFLDEVRNMDRIRSVAWHTVEGVDPSLSQKMIRVEDVSGEVCEIVVYDVIMDTEEKRKSELRKVSLELDNLLMWQHKKGFIAECPFLLEIYADLEGTVNALRKKFPYTGQHEFNLYHDGSLIDPWKDPEYIY